LSSQFLRQGTTPLGKLAILEGDPGLGKSLIALDLCARVTTGRDWPDGAAGSVLCLVGTMARRIR